jgi:alkanesulfonate monooxygenase SsuD/methylene tetrahydromethanopterin reductase-like flavin-dependent oxidoreductase (luciferase family)
VSRRRLAGRECGHGPQVRFGLSLPGYGDGVDAAVVADWAVDAERAGRDGFFLWDHLFAFGSGPMAFPCIEGRMSAAALTVVTEARAEGTHHRGSPF